MNYRQNADKQRRYAIRKMSLCVGSVLIGFFFLAGQTSTVQAAEVGAKNSTLLVAKDTRGDDSSNDASEVFPTDEITNPVVERPTLSTTSTEEMKQIIADIPASNYYDDQQFKLSENEVTIKAGESVQLSLKNPDGSDDVTEQVNWYVQTRYPEEKVYQAGEFVKGENNSQLLQLDSNGTVKNLNNQEKTQRVELWANYNQHLYHASVKLPGTKEMEAIRQDEAANKMADDIIKNFADLSDVEKVKAAHDWLVENVHYVDRPGEDQTAYSALVERQTVCAGYANALKLMLDKMGIPNHTKMGKITGGELHLWNIVELDGKWYHVDATWDYPGNSTRPYSQDRGYNHKNKYFLIHDQDFKLASGAKRDYFAFSEDKSGERYRYYGFEQKGILAKTIEEVGTVLDRQYQKVPFKELNAVLEVMTPADMSLHHIGAKLADILGHGLYKTHTLNYGGYKLHRFAVKLFPKWNTKDGEPSFKVEQFKVDETDRSAKVSSILVTLDKAVELNAANFTVTGARLVNATKVDETTYKLTLDQPKKLTDASVTVAIHKRQHQFKFDNPTLPIQVNQAKKPTAVFTATGEQQGYLSNVEPGMEYRIGQNNWTVIEGERVELTGIGTVDIYLRVPETDQALGSAIQHIVVKKTKDPVTAKALSGKIVGVSKEMEYRRQGDETWYHSPGNILTGLASGKYDIRTRANGEYLASNIETVTLEEDAENMAQQSIKAEERKSPQLNETESSKQEQEHKQDDGQNVQEGQENETKNEPIEENEETQVSQAQETETPKQDGAKKVEEVESGKAEETTNEETLQTPLLQKSEGQQQDEAKKNEEVEEKTKVEQDAQHQEMEKLAETKRQEQEITHQTEIQPQAQEVPRQSEEQSTEAQSPAEVPQPSEVQPQVQELPRKSEEQVTEAQSPAEVHQPSEVQPQVSVPLQASTEHRRTEIQPRYQEQEGQRSGSTEKVEQESQVQKMEQKLAQEEVKLEKKSEDKKITPEEKVTSVKEVRENTEKKQNFILPLVLVLLGIMLSLFGYSKLRNKEE
ncbi:transglutaminase domain-containing protein [Streptococcus ruminantium]|uniref:transglutaminase domain-containing protein n=1 Tax=Streptococcus ruminantium TaxID=1917441 RepID=UPI0012DF7E88|nr:transglutaminase domain-containing protein [Streptococcus ruminantium]